MKSPYRWIALFLLICLFAVNIYRGATQAITCDEGTTYLLFIRGAFSDAWAKYNANNHLLFTYLAATSIRIFGVSDFAFRLPSIFAGGLYLIAAYRICRNAFQYGPLFLLAVCLLSLNPFVLDFLSAARGYGMATSFLLCSIYYFLQLDLRSPQKKILWKLGVTAGLAVGANLTLFFPIIAMGIVLLAWSWLEGRGSALRPTLLHGLGTAALVMALVFAAPFYYAVQLARAKREGKAVATPAFTIGGRPNTPDVTPPATPSDKNGNLISQVDQTSDSTRARRLFALA